MSRAPHRRSPLLRVVGSCWRNASSYSVAAIYEILGKVVLGLALPRATRFSASGSGATRFSRARRYFDAGMSWLSAGADVGREPEPRIDGQDLANGGSRSRGSGGGRPGDHETPVGGTESRFYARLVGRSAFRLRIALARCAHGMGDYLAWRRECGLARQLDPRRFASLPHPFSLFDVVQPHLAAWDHGTWRESARLHSHEHPDPGSYSDSGSGRGAGGNAGNVAVPPTAVDGFRNGLILGRPGLGTPEEVGIARPDGNRSGRHGGPASPPSDDAARKGGSDGDPGGSARLPEDLEPAGAEEDARWLEQVLREFERVLGPDLDAADSPRDPPASRSHDDCRDDGERRRFDALGPVEPEEILRTDLDSLARRLQASDPSP